MTYKAKYQELVELSHSDNPMIREQADAWLISIGLQDAAELNVSAFLLDLAIRNVKGEITREEVSQKLREHYEDNLNLYDEPKTGLDGSYEILPPDSPKIKEIEEYNRYPLSRIQEAYALFAKRDDNVIKTAIHPD